MKCPHGDGWTGPFKSFGGHMASKHRRIMLRNLRKAHTPAARRKAAETRRRRSAKGQSGPRSPGVLPRSGPIHRGRKREVHMTEREAHKFCRQCGGRCPESIHDFCSWCGARCP